MSAKLIGAGAAAVNSSDSALEMISFSPIFSAFASKTFLTVSVIVYVFGNENRRIIINGTEFTDYFELSEQQELINHGEDIFSNWQDHDRQIHDKNVNILNA